MKWRKKITNTNQFDGVNAFFHFSSYVLLFVLITSHSFQLSVYKIMYYMYFVTLALDVSQYTKKTMMFNPTDDGNKTKRKWNIANGKLCSACVCVCVNIEIDMYEYTCTYTARDRENHTKKSSKMLQMHTCTVFGLYWVCNKIDNANY